MTKDTDLHLLAQINSGLRSDMKKLHELGDSLQRLIDQARVFSGASTDTATGNWQSLAASLRVIRHEIQMIDEAINDDTGNTGDPMEHWKVILQQDTQVETLLLGLRNTAGAALPAERQQNWNDLWQTFFHQLTTIRACAAMAQAKAEMRTLYGRAKADAMSQYILSHLPENSNIAEASLYAHEYRRALHEYQANKEKVGGFLGIVKSLLLLQDETPDTVARRRMAGKLEDHGPVAA